MAYVNSSAARANGVFDRAIVALKSLREANDRRRVFKRTLAELQRLSGRELADLGIDRSMITRVAIEAAYGK